LNLARKGLSLKIVDDQHGCPTSARNLALASNAVIDAWQTAGPAKCNGVFHYCDDRSLSWFDFARMIFNFAVDAGLLDHVPDITPVPSIEFPQPAERPKWSVLDTGRLTSVLNIPSASFEHALQTVIDEIKATA